MTIHDLLKNFECKDIKVQFLDECMSNVNAGKKKTKISFDTDALTPNDLVGGTEPCGIIIWIPRNKWKEFQKNYKERPKWPEGQMQTNENPLI